MKLWVQRLATVSPSRASAEPRVPRAFAERHYPLFQHSNTPAFHHSTSTTSTTFPNSAVETTPIPWQRVESTTKKRRTRSGSRPVFYKNIWKTFVVFVRFVVQKIQASPPCALCLREKYKEWICPVLLSRFSPLQVTLTTKLQKNPPFQNSSIPTLQRKNTHKTVVSWVF